MPTHRPSHDATQTFAEYLQSGEEILWTGQPVPGRFVRMAMGPGVLMLPLAVVFLVVFAIQASQREPGGFEPFVMLIPIGFIVLGVLIAVGQLRRTARNTHYAVTNRRLLVARKPVFGKSRLKDYGKGSVEFLHTVERHDGSGHIIFARGFDGNNSKNNGTLRGFIGIERVRDTEKLIRAQEYAPPSLDRAPWYVKLLARF